MVARTWTADLWQRIRLAVVGIRTRVLLWYVLLFAVSIAVALFAIRQVLLTRLDDHVDGELSQEIEELQLLAGGLDPETGEPFGDDLARLFQTYMSRNVPSEGETLIGLVDDAVAAASPQLVAARQLLPALATTWASVDTSTWDETDVPDLGAVRWLAVPVSNVGGTATGTFVVASSVGHERSDIDDAVRVMAIVSGLVLVVASILGWATTGRVLAPIRRVTGAARRISDEDLSERIPVEGNDEVAVLTRTFNDMLDRLESAFSAQRTFLDDLGHELRTPITIVRGQLELLPEDPAERAEAIAVCLDELDRMNREVNDLVTLAKAGRPDFLRLGEVDVPELVDGVELRAVALAPDRRWVIESVAPVTIRADAERLTQAMMNLVTNAAQHTTDGDEIRLGSRVVDGSTQMWVSDAGPGIGPEDQARIFERFGRGDDRRRGGEGTGLGLAIVAAVASAHGGRVVLNSRLGAGSTFTLVLPGGTPSIEDEPAPEPELEAR